MKKAETKECVMTPLKTAIVKIPIKGRTPYIPNKFPDSIKQAITEKQAGIGAKIAKKNVRDVDNEILQAKHFTSDGKDGIPTCGFKAGMIMACQFVINDTIKAGIFKRVVRGITMLDGDIIPLKFKKQSVLTHTIPPNTKYNPQYHEWSCVLNIEYDVNNISVEDLVNLLNYAGHYCGVGTWGPRGKCGGNFGKYKVETK